jgi:flagellar hook protein FlgE
MAAFGSLLAGVTGLNVNQQMLDIIGNDLANSNTTAYKSQAISFDDLFYQTLQPATPSTQNAGGTDPIQVGAGVKMASIRNIMSQGTLQPTGNDLDVGISGAGFFQLNDGTNSFFTRAGAFSVDSSGYLRDPATGFNVMRFGSVGEPSAAGGGFQVPGDDRIKIPFGAGTAGQVTSTVTLQGNLNALAVGAVPTANVTLSGTLNPTAPPGAPSTIQVYDSNGTAHTLSLTYAYDSANSTATDDRWHVTASVPTAEGTVTAGSPITLDFNPTTGALTTSPANASLTFDFSKSNASNSQVMKIGFSGLSQASGSSTAAATSQDGSAQGTGGSVPAAIQIFDSKGTGHTLSLTFAKLAGTPDSWNVLASVPSTEGSVSGTLGPFTFNSDGSLATTGNMSLTFDFSKSGASASQTITFDPGTVKGFNGLTEFGGSSTAAAINQNGFSSGTLSSVSIAKDGTISGVYTNGKVTPLAQLAIATFANAGGLSREGNNLFSETGQSGQALIGSGETAGRGSVQQGVLEQSNVDVAQQFTQLIVAQRGYEVNARTVSVSDQVLQDLTQIIR